MRKHLLLVSVILLVVITSSVVVFTVILPTRNVALFQQKNFTTVSDETPYGEELQIHLDINGGGVKGNSLHQRMRRVHIAITESDSNDLYNVSGTLNGGSFNQVADLMQITISIGVTVTGSNVQNVQIESLYVKTQDKDGSGTHTYTSISSPTGITLGSAYTYTPLDAYSIATLLSDNSANTNGDELLFKVYVKVTAIGTKSGNTLTAEINEEQFADLTFTKQTEQATSDVSPSVSVAAWYDIPVQIMINIVSAVTSAVIVYYLISRRNRRTQL